MISVRLDKSLEVRLTRAASAKGLSKSEYLRKILVENLEKEAGEESPWELGKDLFGRFGSGRSDLSVNRKALFRDKIHAKLRGN